MEFPANQTDVAEQWMEEELAKIYPSDSDTAEHAIGLNQKKVEQFAEEFQEELQGVDSRKWMFVMDVAIHTGESPRQLRRVTDEKGIDPTFYVRMSIHLMAEELGISYQEAGKIARDMVFGTKEGTRLH
jgi:hypothetical protein